MKTKFARIILFSIIAMMSVFLMGSVNQGSANQSPVNEQNNRAKQLQEIAFDFQDIPTANRIAWNSAITNNPELLIRLSTGKLVGINITGDAGTKKKIANELN